MIGLRLEVSYFIVQAGSGGIPGDWANTRNSRRVGTALPKEYCQASFESFKIHKGQNAHVHDCMLTNGWLIFLDCRGSCTFLLFGTTPVGFASPSTTFSGFVVFKV